MRADRTGCPEPQPRTLPGSAGGGGACAQRLRVHWARLGEAGARAARERPRRERAAERQPARVVRRAAERVHHKAPALRAAARARIGWGERSACLPARGTPRPAGAQQACQGNPTLQRPVCAAARQSMPFLACLATMPSHATAWALAANACPGSRLPSAVVARPVSHHLTTHAPSCSFMPHLYPAQGSQCRPRGGPGKGPHAHLYAPAASRVRAPSRCTK